MIHVRPAHIGFAVYHVVLDLAGAYGIKIWDSVMTHGARRALQPLLSLLTSRPLTLVCHVVCLPSQGCLCNLNIYYKKLSAGESLEPGRQQY